MEDTLAVVWMLAFTGDNPMASEIASHIGMSGTMFCRICHARGTDVTHRLKGDEGTKGWLRDFLTAGTMRSREETIEALQEQLTRALAGAPSQAAPLATASGVKDKYFQYFLGVIQDAVTKFRDKNVGLPNKEDHVRTFIADLRKRLPQNIFSPVLEIPGMSLISWYTDKRVTHRSLLDFDAHKDTPVEILHVVLLGVVKYWWRDAVSRLTSTQKDELKTRLSSLDVSGLPTAKLRGNTYVQYAGSLVGRDFRIVLQVAPSVLQGLIPDAHYRGWLALCKLAPMIFQPSIENLEAYLEELEDAIIHFLSATALWSIQWFNKAKFHLFVHLPYHIRRFGPSILYATESFESYNFVIRLRSIHSSKHAPSVDIANAFSHAHAVRHLVSGGYVFQDHGGQPIAPRQAGASVLRLRNDQEFVDFMSLNGLHEISDAGK